MHHSAERGIQATLGFHLAGRQIVSRLETVKKTYGLMPLIWRRLRAKHAGCADITLYGRDGLAIGTGFLWRYEALISLPEAMDFRAISWKQTIDRTERTDFGLLGPSTIPIGARSC